MLHGGELITERKCRFSLGPCFRTQLALEELIRALFCTDLAALDTSAVTESPSTEHRRLGFQDGHRHEGLAVGSRRRRRPGLRPGACR